MFKQDKTMQVLWENYKQELPVLGTKHVDSYFAEIAEQIMGQQLSVKAADAIINRVNSNYQLTPQVILNANPQELRLMGLSFAKIKYIKNLSEHFIQNPETYNNLNNLADDLVIKHLTSVLGIGVWTAQMFLIFTLGRPDVFSSGDLILRKSIDKHYPQAQFAKFADYDNFAMSWAPNRSLASLVLWKSYDKKKSQIGS